MDWASWAKRFRRSADNLNEVSGTVIQAGEIGQVVVVHQTDAVATQRTNASAPFRLARLANESDKHHHPDELRQLSELLLARYAVVDFTGRAAELANLREWRDETDGRTVRVLHGRGGQGKTRLAQRFAAESASAGWAVRQAVRQRPGDRADGAAPVPTVCLPKMSSVQFRRLGGTR
ncbi:hypothetical protein [Saccharothrix stipae]